MNQAEGNKEIVKQMNQSEANKDEVKEGPASLESIQQSLLVIIALQRKIVDNLESIRSRR